MTQRPLTVIIDIKPTQRQALKNLLTVIGNDVTHNHILRFSEIATTHFGRFVLIESGNRQDRDSQVKLYFSCNHDDTWQENINLMLVKFAEGMHAIFSKCQRYPDISPDSKNFKEEFINFIGSNIIRTNTFYSGYPGHRVKEVQSYIKLREAIGECIDKLNLEPVLDALSHLPFPQPKRSRPVQNGLLALLNPILHLVLTPYISNKPSSGISQEVNTRPDLTDWFYTVQNEMTVISAIKPGFFPLFRLRIILWVINYLSKKVFNNGSLGGISTIHFARWVIIDNGENLLFESNYDGNWEQYIGDFVDKASLGLDSIWGNCQGYPARGCKDIQAFKQIIIDHQVRAQVFYSSYPTASIRNILDCIAIGNGINELIERPKLANLLGRI